MRAENRDDAAALSGCPRLHRGPHVARDQVEKQRMRVPAVDEAKRKPRLAVHQRLLEGRAVGAYAQSGVMRRERNPDQL